MVARITSQIADAAVAAAAAGGVSIAWLMAEQNAGRSIAETGILEQRV